MLESLHIKNFAIIENTSLNFISGFNVLIGETGAGKSIIIDALNFVLGGKACKDNIRTGENLMSVKAVFTSFSNEVKQKLVEMVIDCDDKLILARTFSQDGKSSCLINGEPCTVSMLKSLGDILVDMCAQHDSIELLKSKNHIKMLDSYCASEVSPYKKEIEVLLKQYNEIKAKIDELGGTQDNRERIIDLLTYQTTEIENADLKDNEDIELEQRYKALSNFEKITQSLSVTSDNLSTTSLFVAINALSQIKDNDQSLCDLYNRLNSCSIELEDISESLKDYAENLTFDQNELNEIDLRLDLIKMLKKKYGSSIEDIRAFLESSKSQLDDLLNCEEKLQKLESAKKDIVEKLYAQSIGLSTTRRKFAKEIESKVVSELESLSMKNTTFTIKFNDLPECGNCNFTKNGIDVCEFMFSANAGEEERSLAKTISGGEMSRFMLALKNVLFQDEKSLLVFDEIDSGVSGEIGEKVGIKMAQLSMNYQILCITHLPQVTVLADQFIFIKKNIENGKTFSIASVIEGDRLEEYVAMLLGGFNSPIAISHAKEMIENANVIKNKLHK